MTFRTFTHDLVDRVEEIDNRLAEIEQEIEQIEESVDDALASEGVSDMTQLENWEMFKSEYDDLATEQTSLQGERRKFLDAIVHWKTDVDVTMNPPREEVEEAFEDVDECVFRSEELSFGQVQEVQDDMMQESFDVNMENENIEGSPRQGYMQIEFLRKALIDWPEEAPTRSQMRGQDQPEPADYPDVVSEWLFEKIDAFNTTQEESMGNLSLEERMSSR